MRRDDFREEHCETSTPNKTGVVAFPDAKEEAGFSWGAKRGSADVIISNFGGSRRRVNHGHRVIV